MFKKAGYALVAATVGSMVLLGSAFAAQTQADVGGFGSQSTTYNPDVPGSSELTGASLLDSVKTGINWLLGLLGLIALIVLLWGGFQMVTAAGDDNKYKEGFKILKQAGIGLLFIGLAWLFVSLIFYVISIIAP